LRWDFAENEPPGAASVKVKRVDLDRPLHVRIIE
jgi:hypothetical protein